MTRPSTSLSVLLLAGGRGQRMGGQDKGLMPWQGRPMVAWLHDVTRPFTDDLIISCNRNQQLYARYGDRLIGDDNASFEGPLAGIRAGLSIARHSNLLILPCDAPRVDRNLVQELVQLAGPQPVVVSCGDWIEPMFCVIPTSLSSSLEEAWLNGERSPQRWLLGHSPVILHCPANDPRLSNFNTPESLQDLE